MTAQQRREGDAMGERTAIDWCQHTFNPWRGCTKVSPGCANCYAETLSLRNPAVLGEWGPRGQRVVASETYWRQPLAWDRAARAAGERRRVFCLSLGDWLEDRPELVAPLGRLCGLIRDTPHLDWLLLSKRPESWSDRLHAVVAETHDGGDVWASAWLDGASPPNVWLGVSVEDRARLDRIDLLRQTPAALRFLSVEPLLEDLGTVDLRGIDWIIVGGESGPRHRPCRVEWVRSLAGQCRAAGVACWVKQGSGSYPGRQGDLPEDLWGVKELPVASC
jgi:protein gp37